MATSNVIVVVEIAPNVFMFSCQSIRFTYL